MSSGWHVSRHGGDFPTNLVSFIIIENRPGKDESRIERHNPGEAELWELLEEHDLAPDHTMREMSREYRDATHTILIKTAEYRKHLIGLGVVQPNEYDPPETYEVTYVRCFKEHDDSAPRDTDWFHGWYDTSGYQRHCIRIEGKWYYKKETS